VNFGLFLAYTYYAFFEWSLVVWDITFDSFAILDFQHLQVSITLTPLIVPAD
jgi:hypothetical protein